MAAAFIAVAFALTALPSPAFSSHAPAEVGAVPLFTNITLTAGLGSPATALSAAQLATETAAAFINGGKGAAWFDYDQDGWEDLLITGVHRRELYRSGGDGTFADVTSASGLSGDLYSMGVITPDINNDGFPDVVLANWFGRSEVFLNNGNGTFRNVTASWNFLFSGPATGIAFGDLDGDGWGDLYIGSYYRRAPGLFRNLQGQGLQDMGSRTGIKNLTEQTFQPLIFDYDLDGDLDIFESNDFGPDSLYRNEGDWSFTDVSVASGVAIMGDGMGAAIGDLNGDGYMDIFVTNFAADYWLVFDPRNGTYSDVHVAANITDPEVGWGVQTMDFNNDGHLDIFVADGSVIAGQPDEADKLFINRGDNTFFEAGGEAGVKDWGHNRGSAASDFNKDGALDLWVANVVGNSSFYRGEGGPNHWFEVTLEGVVTQRQAVGARLALEAGGRTQTRQVHMGSSYLSQDSLVQHFGLGADDVVQRLTVDWPSGAQQVFTDLGSDRRFFVKEYEGNAPTAVAPDIMTEAGTEILFDGSASWDDTGIVEWNWSFSEPYPNLTLSGPNPKVTFFDSGNFTGSLNIADGFGNRDGVGFTIAVRPATHPLVYAGPDLQVVQNGTVAFSATLKGPQSSLDYTNTTFVWTITGPGGDITFPGRNISHTFVLPGLYAVKVNATDVYGLWGEDSLVVTVGDPEPPLIVFTPPDSVPEDTTFTLDASRTTDNDPSFPGSGLFYWRVTGPGTQFEVRTGAVTDFTLTDPGPARFELEVADASGNVAALQFVIQAIDGTPPLADGGADRVVSAGSTVRLDASNSTDNDPALQERGTFEWTFTGPDPPGRSYGVVTQVVVTNPGVTLVRLNVRDPSGNKAVRDDEFTITAVDTTRPSVYPQPDLDVAFGEAAIFAVVNATDNDPAFPGNGRFTWQFRDGGASRTLSGPNVPYTFAEVGAHRVELVVGDAAGNYARTNFTVTVLDRAAPLIRASVVNASLVGEPVELNATGSFDDVGIASFAWSFDPPVDVQVLNGPYVRWTFRTPGNYTVTLRVVDTSGNPAVAQFPIEVRPLEAPPLPGPTGETPTPGPSAPSPENSALSAAGIGLTAGAGLAAIMLFRRWRREPA